ALGDRVIDVHLDVGVRADRGTVLARVSRGASCNALEREEVDRPGKVVVLAFGDAEFNDRNAFDLRRSDVLLSGILCWRPRLRRIYSGINRRFLVDDGRFVRSEEHTS